MDLNNDIFLSNLFSFIVVWGRGETVLEILKDDLNQLLAHNFFRHLSSKYPTYITFNRMQNILDTLLFLIEKFIFLGLFLKINLF